MSVMEPHNYKKKFGAKNKLLPPSYMRKGSSRSKKHKATGLEYAN